MHVITLVTMLVVVAVLASKLLSERPTPQLRPVRIKKRQDQDQDRR